MQLHDYLFSHLQLLKDLERIAGNGDLTMEIVSSWNNTWARRIIKVDSPKSSVRSQIFTDYDHDNRGMYFIIALHACTYTDTVWLVISGRINLHASTCKYKNGQPYE